VPQRVNPYPADAVVIADAGEGAHEVARLNRAASPGEDQAGIYPGITEPFAVARLDLVSGR
jgi:hypothetical protein